MPCACSTTIRAARRAGCRSVEQDIEFIAGDIRDPAAVTRAVRGMDEVHHLAFVNGTEFFYSAPELVLDVGVKGMINVIDACRSAGVGSLVLASSSEVYQTPPQVPTDETRRCSCPIRTTRAIPTAAARSSAS